MSLTLPKAPFHFIGIGGSGMGPLAEIAQAFGHSISGSDLKSSKTTERLAKHGATIYYHHDAAHVTNAASVVVSSAIKADNLELIRAQELKLPILHRSDMLQFLMQGKRAITVAGTHGKTTTTALIAHMLKSMGADPTAAVGGVLLGYESSAMIGASDLFVAEADESDGSFLKYRPSLSVLTNVENDHLDFYKNEAGLDQAFLSYLQNTDLEGTAVICWDNPGSQRVGHLYEGQRLSYGLKLGAEVRARNIKSSYGTTQFQAIVEYEQAEVNLPLLGKHNVGNALAALAVARALGLDIKHAAASLTHFKGVARRMARVFENAMVTVYDDYAHNPGKIAACVTALREAWPTRKLLVVFQPHRYSRMDTMYDEFMRSFEGADRVFVLPVYAAGEKPTRPYEPSELAKDILQGSRVPSEGLSSFDACVARLTEEAHQPAVIVTVGAGDVWQVSKRLGDMWHGETRGSKE